MKINHIASAVLVLSSVTEVLSQRKCYRGFTGEDSGGSCSFSQSLCDWSIQNNGTKGWKLNTDSSHIQFNTYIKEDEESSVLISPLMCEKTNTNTSLKFQFKIESIKQRTLTLNLKCEESNCSDSLIWSRNTSRRRNWEEECVDFQFPKTFKIFFEAKKQKGVSGTDADFSIDNITYNNKCCSCTDIPTVMTETIPATSSSYFTFTRHSATTGSQTKFTYYFPSTASSTDARSTSTSGSQTKFTYYFPSTASSTDARSTITSASSPENTDLHLGPILGSVCAIVVLIAVIIVVIVIVQKRRVRRKSVTKPYESTTPPRSESEKSSSKTNSYSEAGELDPTVRIDEGADDTVTYTIPGAPGAHPRSTRSTAQRSKRGPPQAVPTEQAAREEQPEYIEIENETRHNGEDGYLVPTSQYASLSTTRKSEEGHEYEKFGPKPTGSSSTVEYSGLIKSTKREKHLYDVLEKKETKQTGETGKQDPSRAAVVKKGSGKTSSSVKS